MSALIATLGALWLVLASYIAFESLARRAERKRDAGIIPWRPTRHRVQPPIARRRG